MPHKHPPRYISIVNIPTWKIDHDGISGRAGIVKCML